MMPSAISYNIPAMEALEKEYQGPIDLLDAIIDKTKKLQWELENAYKGKASEALKESFTPLLKHLELLKLSYAVGQSYVSHAIVEMTSTDAKLADLNRAVEHIKLILANIYTRV
jgi:uncharacterized protein YukE